jgi:hypothetical protein
LMLWWSWISVPSLMMQSTEIGSCLCGGRSLTRGLDWELGESALYRNRCSWRFCTGIQNSCGRLSGSQTAFSLWTRVEITACLFGRWWWDVAFIYRLACMHFLYFCVLRNHLVSYKCRYPGGGCGHLSQPPWLTLMFLWMLLRLRWKSSGFYSSLPSVSTPYPAPLSVTCLKTPY